jgi:signal transduction histidine kinase
LDRKQLEFVVSEKTSELQTALADLQNSEARRRQLLSEISHELRTPTTAIRGEAEVALRGREKLASEYREALQRIGETSIQLGNVINDLLTLARSDVDALVIQSSPVDLAQAALRAIQQASGNAALRDVEIHKDIGHEPVIVMGDMSRLQQLIGLILDNAIRYSHHGGSVIVRLEVADAEPHGRVRLAIEDRGIGIARGDLELIFERHFRGAEARHHRPDGTGLGLAIAAVLARLHNASITVDSAPGKGAAVALTFPLPPAVSLAPASFSESA